LGGVMRARIQPGMLTVQAAAALNEALRRVEELDRKATPKVNEPIYYEMFPAKITAVTTGKYSWTEQFYDSTGAYVNMPNGRTGTSTTSPAYERNGAVATTFPFYVQLMRRVSVDGFPVYEFDAGNSSGGNTDCDAVAACLFTDPVSLTVATNTCPTIGVLTFDTADGNVTDVLLDGVSILGASTNVVTSLTVETKVLGLPTGTTVGDAVCETDPDDCCPPPVETNCCANPIPAKLYCSLIATDDDDPAVCPGGGLAAYLPWVIELDYDSGSSKWTGSSSKTVDGCTLTFRLCVFCAYSNVYNQYLWFFSKHVDLIDADGCTSPCIPLSDPGECGNPIPVIYYGGAVTCSPFSMRVNSVGDGYTMFSDCDSAHGFGNCFFNAMITE
jgi:hypothetical protein